MCSPRAINSIGLIFDIIGILILFTMDFKIIGLGGHNLYVGGPAEGEVKKEKRKAYLGLGFIVIGFVLQLISNFL
jgi:hypothetical protein